MWTALSFGTFADNTLRQALLIGIPAGVISAPFFSNADNALPLIGTLLPAAILIFSSVSGQLADKYETSMMFRRTKLAELILMCAAAIAFATGAGWLAVLMLFAMGAQSAFFSPVRTGAMPKYLAPNELVRGNGLCNAGLFTFILLGYMTGAVLIVLDNGGVMVGAVLISASIVGFLAALQTPVAAANEPGLRLNFNGFSQTARMFRFVFESRGVAPPLLGTGVFYFLSTALTVIIPLYGRDALHATPLVWAALNGLFAVGVGLGAITAASLPKGRSSLGASCFAIAAAGLSCFLIYVLTPFAAGSDDSPLRPGDLFSGVANISLTSLFIFTSALCGLYIAPLQAATQRRAPPTIRSRIMAAGVFTNAVFAILGSLSLLAITANGADPRFAFIAAGVVMLGVAAIMYHRRRRLPEGLYDEMLRPQEAAAAE